jgi:hypothetical protein
MLLWLSQLHEYHVPDSTTLAHLANMGLMLGDFAQHAWAYR